VSTIVPVMLLSVIFVMLRVVGVTPAIIFMTMTVPVIAGQVPTEINVDLASHLSLQHQNRLRNPDCCDRRDYDHDAFQPRAQRDHAGKKNEYPQPTWQRH
jgi:hypothetical protein